MSIAIMPFLLPKWWHKNYGKFSIVLASIVVLYYVFVLRNTHEVLRTAEEYISFISLLTGLFVVSGGIYFKIKGKATPLKNTITLLIGSLTANLFGTTGAAMLLVRPYIASNKYRLKPYHIIFFIFTVCNMGGSLTPIGDPPLFLGYLKGVPFFWIIKELIGIWAIGLAYVLVIFFLMDTYYYRKLKVKIQQEVEEKGEDVQFGGLFNIFFLFTIIGAVFITEPPFLREIIMLTAAFISYKLTPPSVHKRNRFNFEPIKEVALLFVGIFMTMIPVLSYLNHNSAQLGISKPGQFFWASGILTSFLDNAPTYLNFLTLSMGLQNLNINNSLEVLMFLDNYKIYVIAISVASVFFGAMSYIGNGPNFMVKSIAEHKGIKMPGFFAYIYKYSLPVLIPMFFVIWLLFFR
ncbi:MAG: sodium:proton antiporter [Ignavibacteria bacterium]|nr:sodium:proton antiporter [Ignavibacteria bacterium]